jgi:hypothetical protein
VVVSLRTSISLLRTGANAKVDPLTIADQLLTC